MASGVTKQHQYTICSALCLNLLHRIFCLGTSFLSQLIPEDEFLLIASDGLWNVMSSEEAVNFVLEAKASIDDEREDPSDEDGCELSYQLIAEGLVDHAIEELSSDDNVTVIIIFLRPEQE